MPRRRCVGCGRVAPKPELLRLAAVPAGRDGHPVAAFDRTSTIPGRGAYVCRGENGRPERDCLRLATSRGVLQRAFRRPVEVAAELLGPLESEGR